MEEAGKADSFRGFVGRLTPFTLINSNDFGSMDCWVRENSMKTAAIWKTDNVGYLHFFFFNWSRSHVALSS